MPYLRNILKLDIGIAGGGIGGLAVSVALSRLGHMVTVYEAASELVQVCTGAHALLRGFTPLTTSADRRWHPDNSERQQASPAMGVGEHLPELRDSTPCFKVHRWEDGKLIGRMKTEEHHEQYGGPYVQVHRADRQQSLLKVAERNGVKVHTKSRVVDYDFDKPTMVLHDGQRIEKDLVFSADGESQLFSYEERRRDDGGVGIKSVARRK